MSRVAAATNEDDLDSDADFWDPPSAKRKAPNILGLFFDPDLRIDEDYATKLVSSVLPYFNGGISNQVMLFGSSLNSSTMPPDGTEKKAAGLPSFIGDLIACLAGFLREHISSYTHELLFPEFALDPRPISSALSAVPKYPARQVIFNLYRPGEGITPHIDLPGRYGDGIIVLSLLSGTVMSLTSTEHLELLPTSQPVKHDLWLPPRSILILEKDARHLWKHGIAARKQDFVEEESGSGTGDMWWDREMRVSITIRWMLPGAHIVGGV